MRNGLRFSLALLGLALLPQLLAESSATAATLTFVTNGAPFRLDKAQPATGGQSASALSPAQDGGFVATWLNYRSTTDRRAVVGFYSSSASPRFPLSEMGAATGPTSGRPAVSAAPVGCSDGTALALFSADRRSAAAAEKRDVFAQRMGSGPWTPIGEPIGVNSVLANAQDTILATRLSNGNALVAFVTHATAPGSFDIRGRILNSQGGAVTPERALTPNTAGAQTPTSLAALTSGRSALAYVVKSGQTQQVLVERLDSSAVRIEAPTPLKATTGAATYGGAGVAALSGGRFLALWFAPGAGGTASLKGRIVSSAGQPGAVLTIGSSRILSTALTAPRIVVQPDGRIVVVTGGLAGGTYSIEAWLLNAAAGRLVGPIKLVTGSARLTPEGLVRLSDGNLVASWTQAAAQVTATRAMAVRFRVVTCNRAC